MKTFLLVAFSLTEFLSYAQTSVVLKVIGINKYITFYKDETLKKNQKGEVISGTLVIDYIFFPQGSNLNIAFKQGSLITFNSTGKVISGTVAADYNLKTTTGVFKTFSNGDNVTFNEGGQVTKEAVKENTINYGEVCIYNTIPFYCNSMEYNDAYSRTNVTSGIVAKGNVEFPTCGGFLIKAKKNTKVELFPSSNSYRVVKDDEEAEAWKSFNKCLVGTVEKIILDGPRKFFVFGCAHSVEFPDGSEVTLEPHMLKPVWKYIPYCYVIKAKLGKDAIIPTLGLVKKGKTVRGVHPFTDGLQVSQGYMVVE